MKEDIPATDRLKTSSEEVVKGAQRDKVSRILAEQEYAAAARIIKQSQQNITSIFNDICLLNEGVVMSLVDDIFGSISRNEGALISLLSLNRHNDMHPISVCALMMMLARALGLSETETKQAGSAGLLHDMGKVAIPQEILNKPGMLTDEEYALMMSHPEKGLGLLESAGITDAITLDVCLHHHEKIDGTGYPKKLKDDEISLFVRMAAVCDVYDAIVSHRPYKTGWGERASLDSMMQWEGHFDEEVFDVFVKNVSVYPIGSIVLLKSGRLAVVIEQSQKVLLQPIVKVFFSTHSNTYLPEEMLDLSSANVQDEIVRQEFADTWGVEDISQL
jgi:HD-GYP domain-containing protein (c-di-GMP phosphodiesterase class II)